MHPVGIRHGVLYVKILLPVMSPKVGVRSKPSHNGAAEGRCSKIAAALSSPSHPFQVLRGNIETLLTSLIKRERMSYRHITIMISSYSLSGLNLQMFQEYFHKNFQKRFICPSAFPAEVPIFFVMKKDISLAPALFTGL